MSLWFGCRHKQTSFPITRKCRDSNPAAATYIVCLECGREFPYDWSQMKVVKRAMPRTYRVSAPSEPAVSL